MTADSFNCSNVSFVDFLIPFSHHPHIPGMIRFLNDFTVLKRFVKTPVVNLVDLKRNRRFFKTPVVNLVDLKRNRRFFKTPVVNLVDLKRNRRFFKKNRSLNTFQVSNQQLYLDKSYQLAFEIQD